MGALLLCMMATAQNRPVNPDSAYPNVGFRIVKISRL